MVALCKQLSNEENCTILKGNHELECIEYFEKGSIDNWIYQCGQKTIDDFQFNQIDEREVSNWFAKMPLKFETDSFVVTHAGISETENPFDENNMDGVLWTRKQIKNIGKVQFHGHTPLLKSEPTFNEESNSWNLDTDAFYKFGLTGIKIDKNGKKKHIIQVDTDLRDIQ